MLIAEAAKQIGADQFDSSTLAQFLQTKNGVKIPLSRTLVNPGPSVAPSEKQPYARLYQWKGGTFNLIPAGPAKDGWLQGWL
jgi:hypothetical protein